jgi:hypothetical protein
MFSLFYLDIDLSLETGFFTETRKSPSPKRKKRGTDELFEKPKHQFNPKLALWPDVDNESLHSLCEAIMAKIVRFEITLSIICVYIFCLLTMKNRFGHLFYKTGES